MLWAVKINGTAPATILGQFLQRLADSIDYRFDKAWMVVKAANDVDLGGLVAHFLPGTCEVLAILPAA